MDSAQPSRTAHRAALHRAAHQVLEEGRIFSDPLALAILGLDAAGVAATVAQEAARRPSGQGMRLFIAARTRFAEDALAAAVEQGVGQLVVLGAGLDTNAYRGPLRDRLRIFEVDHPATQEWKRQRLAAAGIPLPACLTFAPIDFERETLAAGLDAAGFDSSAPAFFTWLGVTVYLTVEAVWDTLRFIAALPGGAHVVFDYATPPAALPPEMQAIHNQRAARVAELGEPWITFFDPDELRVQLTAAGFSTVEDLGPREIAERYLPTALPVPKQSGHILHAATPLG